MSTRPHLIQKLNVEVTFNGVAPHSDPGYWPAVVRNWLDEVLLPQLEAYFDTHYGHHEETLKIDALQIDLGQLSASLFAERNPISILHILDEVFEKEQIASLTNQLPKATLSERELEAFLFFLSSGRLPWWKTPAPDTLVEWELQLSRALEQHRVPFEQMMSVFRNEAARKRIEHSFSKRFQKQLLMLLQHEARSRKENYPIIQMPASVSDNTDEFRRKHDLSMPQNDRTDTTRTDKALYELVKASGAPHFFIEEEGIREEAIYVQNAGIVLLHSFFQTFLERLGHAKAGKMLKSARAMQVLQVLATGSTAPEYKLALNKLLCGVEQSEFVKIPNRLTKKETTECEHLLHAVIGHWSRLGDTSPAGLRGTFLCREGKLSRRQDNNWLLQVEQRGFDVLLNDLPWSISMIKLPWMPNMLYVEWA